MPCDAVVGFDYHGTTIKKIPGGLTYFYLTSRMAIDADGAPNAYHPRDIGIDALANAGYPHGSWKSIILPDPAHPDRPFVQTEGEFAGYFVSQTTLQDRSLPATNIRRYVDSREVPYIVFPGRFYRMSGTGDFGDFGVAINIDNGKETPFIVADAGPSDAPLGEVSIRLAENLGGSHVNPRTGAGMPRGRFVYVVFPRSKSAPPWPIGSEQLQHRAYELLTDIGGWERIRPCLP